MVATSGIPKNEAELLIAHWLQKPRSFVIAHDEEILQTKDQEAITALFQRRESHEPLAYILGYREFYGRRFRVTPDVLIPRPATESLINFTKDFLKGEPIATQKIDAGISAYILRKNHNAVKNIIDVGTGSGCIAITLEKEGIKNEIIGIDISEKAIEIAKSNKELLRAENTQCIFSDGKDYIEKQTEPFLLVSNPPYIPMNTVLDESVRNFEPLVALFAGSDGLSMIRPLMNAALRNSACTGIILEVRDDQVSFLDAMKKDVLGI